MRILSMILGALLGAVVGVAVIGKNISARAGAAIIMGTAACAVLLVGALALLTGIDIFGGGAA